jgi:hypothetical protein
MISVPKSYPRYTATIDCSLDPIKAQRNMNYWAQYQDSDGTIHVHIGSILGEVGGSTKIGGAVG